MKKMKLKITSAIAILFTLGLYGQEAKITVHVADESGLAISNAQVRAGFMTALKPGEGWGTGGENNVEGATDTNGFCSVSGQATAGFIGLSVWKDGYYGNGGQRVSTTNIDMLTRRWEPWNPTIEVVLKKKGVQVPMYARRPNEIIIPVKGESLGYDLMVGDWVAPYGKGETSDFIIKVDSKPEPPVPAREYPPYDITLTVSFSNDGDGIQSFFAPPRVSSELRLPRQAPSDGYESILTKREYKERGQSAHTDFRDDQNYFYRVRTKKDAQGNIVSALYGKISGDFLVSGRDDNKLTFTYYLNPKPNSQDMEFDPKRNLSKNLKFMEGVNAP
jgi:hypothetical protein